MAFATTSDIAARLELSSLSATQSAAATQLLATASAVISHAAGEGDEAWFADLTTGSTALVKGLTVELVCRAMASPQGLSSATQTLGEYSRSESYRRDLSTALLLTPAEENLVRRMAGTGSSGSVRVPSLVHDVYVTEPE